MRLQNKKDLHLARKAWHVCGVAFLIYLYYQMDMERLVYLGGFLTSSVVLIDLCRLQFSSFNKLVQSLFFFCIRAEEKNKLSGLSYMVIGAYAISLLFPRDVVTLSLIFLAVGDPIASLVGVKYGQNKIGSKSLEGSLAALVACTLASAIYFIYFGYFSHRIFIAIPVAGAWGAISELVQIKFLDDNLTLPLLSGFGLWALFFVLGA